MLLTHHQSHFRVAFRQRRDERNLTDEYYPTLSWILHKPHPNAVKRMSHVKDARHKQTCDFCVPTSYGLFVCLLTKRGPMPSKCGKQAVVVEPVEHPHH